MNNLKMLRTGERFNSNTFAVDAEKLFPFSEETKLVLYPEQFTNRRYILYNLGRNTVEGELLCSDSTFGDRRLITSIEVEPGQNREFTVNSNCYSTSFRVININKTRAIVHIRAEPGDYEAIKPKEPGSFDLDMNKVYKELVNLGAQYVPYVGAVLSALIQIFWPENKENVWEEIKDKAETLMNQKVRNLISATLRGDIKYYQQRIKTLADDLKKGQNSSHYMNIAEDLIGLENKFSFGKETDDYKQVNFVVLPLYSNLILMKVAFYRIGIVNAGNIGLNRDEVDRIKKYMREVIGPATDYIKTMYQERVSHAYNTCFPEDVYNTMMNVRSYIAVHGLEFIPVWNHMLKDPFSNALPYNDVISYSQFFGIQTANLNRQAATDTMMEPLTPDLINGKRNQMKSIDLYMWKDKSGVDKIGGLQVTFENGKHYMMGTQSSDVHHIDFNGAFLKKFIVFGDVVDRFEFYFSDGRIFRYGAGNSTNEVFEMANHHIASIFVSSDYKSLLGRAMNVAVSFQRNCKK